MTVGGNPFPPGRRWVGQRHVENGNALPLLAAPTDGHDLVGLIEIHAVDPHGDAEQLRHKRAGEVLLEHGEKPDPLLGVAVRVNDRFFDEGVELALG